MKQNVIELKDVAKHYSMGEELVKALDCINVTIEEGNFVAIMGPSGSGKSTGMNLIGSLDLPTTGKIYLGNQNIDELEESELAQVRGKAIGFIFQQFNLIPNLTAKENIMLPMIFQNTNEDEREIKVKELLDLVELGDRGNHYPNQLSGGQQQRVAIARALANDPKIILADEPTGNLDSKTGEKVLDFLKKMNEKGKTIIMVTHDENIARKYARKLYMLKDGKIDNLEIKEKDKWRKINPKSC